MLTVNIPETVQDAVDQYLELYQVSKQLEERMGGLRKVIEPFMKDNGVDALRNRKQTGKIQLVLQERAKVTARYTTYEVASLLQVLDSSLVQRCLVEVVDKEKVEALCKLGEIPSDVSEHRLTTPSYSLNVRFER